MIGIPVKLIIIVAILLGTSFIGASLAIWNAGKEMKNESQRSGERYHSKNDN